MINNKNSLKLLFLLLLVNFQVIWSQYYVPSWFMEKPEKEGIIVSVGYTGYFIRRENARKMSALKAIIDACAYSGISISTTYLEEMKLGYIISVENSEEAIDNSHWDCFSNNYSALDSFFTDEGYYILIVIGDSKGLNYSHDLTDWGDKPSWIESLPDDSEYIYGLGISGVHSTHAKAWLNADKNARSDLAKNICITAKSGELDLSNDYYSLFISTINQKSEITLSGVEIIRRWYNQDTGEHYSLARAKKIPVKIIYGSK